VLLVALLALAGCGGAAAGPDVLGDWVYVSGSSGSTPLPQPPGGSATLVVEESQLSGISFCDHYSAGYTLDGADLVLTGPAP
jgi:hypothetical protein